MLKYPSPVSIKDKDYSPKLNQDYYIEEKIDGSQLSVGFIDDAEARIFHLNRNVSLNQ
jgi:hypothetical protein